MAIGKSGHEHGNKKDIHDNRQHSHCTRASELDVEGSLGVMAKAERVPLELERFHERVRRCYD